MLPTNRPPTHPGEMLLKEFLEPLGVSQVEAANRMNIPFQRLNAIVRGRRGVSADTTPVRGADTLGRADLVDTSGEVGPVACHESAGAAAEGSGPAQDRVTAVPAVWRESGSSQLISKALHGEGTQLSAIELIDGRTSGVDALYLGPRTRLNSEVAHQLGEMAEGPFGPIIRTDPQKMTTAPAVYAAGDITRSAHNVTWASADGVTAGLALHRSLVF